jgi:hypothetical protein
MCSRVKEGQFVGLQVEPVLNFGKMLEGLLAVPSATTVAWPEQNPIDLYPISARSLFVIFLAVHMTLHDTGRAFK